MAMILGIDEAGRGPVIGPMVMAGVLIDEEDIAKLEKLGVKDSKKILPIKREAMFDEIKKLIKDHWIFEVSNDEIDAALKDGTSNLNWLEADTSIKMIMLCQADIAQLDCPSCNIASYKNYIAAKLDGKKIELIVEHKADDRYMAVGAASILAKVTRDRLIKKLCEEYGDFGSGYCSDPKTKAFIEKNHDLPIYRRTWDTWKRIDEAKKQSSLFDF